jgi:cell division protein FtsW
MLGLILLALLMLVVVAKYRSDRLTEFFSPQANPVGPDQQPIQGKWAVGSGGWFGVGLGASTQKWGWVPDDTTDFIFAIIGEELGLVGTLCVSLLYGGLAYAGLRIARRVEDTFVRLAAAGATIWIVGQAIVNIGAVIGLIPITGVPLPLVSAGLSSLVTTMVALGMLMSFARQEPGAAQALADASPGPARRALSWLGLDRRRE